MADQPKPMQSAHPVGRLHPAAGPQTDPSPEAECFDCQQSGRLSVGRRCSRHSLETRTFSVTDENGAPMVVEYTYYQWIGKVNRMVVRISGLSVDDLPDWNSWDAWSRGETPYEGATEALENADFPFED